MRSVVFPDPDGPRSVRNSPSRISRSASSTAKTCPYVFRSFRTSDFARASGVIKIPDPPPPSGWEGGGGCGGAQTSDPNIETRMSGDEPGVEALGDLVLVAAPVRVVHLDRAAVVLGMS